MKSINLLEGKILPALTRLTIPIVATSLISMAYNLIDMLWIGKLGANSVAAVGVAGMFGWFSAGLCLIARVGGQVKVGHSLGQQNEEKVIAYASSAIHIGILFAGIFSVVTILMSLPLIDFFNLNSQATIDDALIYLRLTCGLIVFNFINQIITGIENATGDSHTPFVANSIGLIINLILDPIFIFGIGVPKMGVCGAAMATVIAQIIVFLVFIYKIKKQDQVLNHIRLLTRYRWSYYRDIIKIGFPMGLQSMLFSLCSMVIARFVAGYGDGAVAAQKIGSQVENISWNMADGFEAAVNSFIAQNYGAKKYDRVNKGFWIMMVICFVWGMICSIALLFFPKEIFQLFLSDAHVLPIGIDYLRIIGFSQLLMIIEITLGGCFSGLGNSFPPSIISIVFTLGRIPVIMLLSYTTIGVNGIFWTISISSILKGSLLFVWFLYYKRSVLRFPSTQ